MWALVQVKVVKVSAIAQFWKKLLLKEGRTGLVQTSMENTDWLGHCMGLSIFSTSINTKSGMLGFRMKARINMFVDQLPKLIDA